MGAAVVATLALVAVEVAASYVGHSISLLSDAIHNLTDIPTLVISWLATRWAKRPPTHEKTYGYHRAEILAAFFNGAILILLSAYIFYDAAQRFTSAPKVNTSLMLIVAAIGLASNLAGMYLLRRGSSQSINIRSAFWHIIGDTMSSVGVIIAAIIIRFTGFTIADPILAIIIGLVILWGAVRIVRESIDILLESVPKELKVEDVTEAVKKVAGVEDLHEVHIWTITSGIYALSAHLKIADQTVSESSDILTRVNEVLVNDFNISHTTLQLECASCPTGMVCNLPSKK